MTTPPQVDTFTGYAAASRVTATYARSATIPVYPSLGIAGETGEVAEKVVAYVEHRCDLDAVAKELGDVLWYATQLANDFEFPLAELAGRDTLTGAATAGDPIRSTLELTIAVSRVSETMKKTIRDHDGILTAVMSARVRIELAGVLRALDVLAASLQLDIADVANQNLAKLYARAAQNLVGGDGDDRETAAQRPAT